MATAKKKTEEIVEIKPIKLERVKLRVVGETPLIVHAWSEKAKRQMLEAQQGVKAGKKKEAKNPVQDFVNTAYWLTPMPEEETYEAFVDAVEAGARFMFPITALKNASVAAPYRMGWTKDKVSMRGSLWLMDQNPNGDIPMDMMEIHYEGMPEMREDMVKVGMGVADLRYRMQYNNWHMDVVLEYNKSGQYSLENLLNIINAGGLVCGLGEWRNEKGGLFGRYHVEGM